MSGGDAGEGLRFARSQHRCPYCHDRVEVEASVACQACLARHHVACWDEHGACSSCGEATSLAPREATRAAADRPSPLDVLPEPLSGSRIEVTRTADGAVRLEFPGVRLHVGSRPEGMALGLGVVFGLGAGMLAGAIALSEASGAAASAAAYGLGFLLGLLPFAPVVGWGWRRLQAEKAEPPRAAIELRPDAIRIERPHTWRGSRLPMFEARRGDVGDVSRDGFGNLFADLGAERVLLAAGLGSHEAVLSDPEVRWLRGVLTRWLHVDPRGDTDPGGPPSASAKG